MIGLRRCASKLKRDQVAKKNPVVAGQQAGVLPLLNERVELAVCMIRVCYESG